jgi:hypothetical protein
LKRIKLSKFKIKTMKNLLTFILISCLTYTAQAQGLIAVQEDSVTVEFYTDLATAFDSAAPNSTVYLPGGGFILSTSYIINKPLNIIGAGYNVDSTQATNQTVLPQIRFGSGADGSSITGCYITSYIVLDTINNLLVKRCSFDYIYTFGISTNISITENYVRTTNPSYGINRNSTAGSFSNCLINKNRINGSIFYISQSVFSNNIMLYVYSASNSGYSVFNDVTSCTFKNNYIYDLDANGVDEVSGSVFYNNVAFYYSINVTVVSNNQLTGKSLSDTFEQTSGDTYYQIKSTSLAKNHGTDGTDIGIFGSSKPWKIGGLPDNPHIYFIDVEDENNGANGTLPVQIGVSGQ